MSYPSTQSPLLCRRPFLDIRGWALAAFVLAFVIAIAVDIPVSTWVHDRGISTMIKNHQVVTKNILRAPGRFPFTVVASSILLILAGTHWLWSRPGALKRLNDAILVFVAGLLSGVNALIKWAVGRTRPFHDVGPFDLHPFKGGTHGAWLAEQNLSFPSGDVSLAFAMTASLGMVAPRYWPLWWGLGIMVILERIAEGAHYPSDTIAGAALGIAAAWAARRLIPPVDPTREIPAEITDSNPAHS